MHTEINLTAETSFLSLDMLEDTDLFADELDERYNAGTISSTTCVSSASCAGTSSASCICTTSTLCSA